MAVSGCSGLLGHAAGSACQSGPLQVALAIDLTRVPGQLACQAPALPGGKLSSSAFDSAYAVVEARPG
jgi:hypothetical protein